MFLYQQQAVAIKIDVEVKVRCRIGWEHVNIKVKDEMRYSLKIKKKYWKEHHFFQKRKGYSRTSYTNVKEVEKTQLRGNVKTLRRGQTN